MYSVSDIQGYFDYIIKKHAQNTDNPPVRIYVNNVENRISFEIRAEYYLGFLTFKIMKLIGSTNWKYLEALIQ